VYRLGLPGVEIWAGAETGEGAGAKSGRAGEKTGTEARFGHWLEAS
jgi:hypothetical protein